MFAFKADSIPLHRTSQYSRITIAKYQNGTTKTKTKKTKKEENECDHTAQTSDYLQLPSHNNYKGLPTDCCN